MITGFKNIGQLGNQLFIFAIVSSHRSFCLNQLGLLHYFSLPTGWKLTNRIKSDIVRVLNLFKKQNTIKLDDGWRYYSENQLFHPGKWVKGYFQSEKYFFQNKNRIIKNLKIKKRYREKFNENLSQFQNKKLAVIHIRRGDYQNVDFPFLQGPDLTLPVHYYRKVINQLDKDLYQFVFISDDIEFVENQFSDVNAYFSKADFITDFQFLINADVLVLSNSSFSWWGAYLNSKKEKRVFCPEFWLGFKIEREYPVDCIPEEWTKVNVWN